MACRSQVSLKAWWVSPRTGPAAGKCLRSDLRIASLLGLHGRGMVFDAVDIHFEGADALPIAMCIPRREEQRAVQGSIPYLGRYKIEHACE